MKKSLNELNHKKIPVITLQGPTAVGKTDLAIHLAKKFDLEIISADSRQIYKKLNIGTAKPNSVELQAVKHHLIDIIDPKEKYDAGRFREEATQIITDLDRRNKKALIVGGTGFYIKSLFQELFRINQISDSTKNEVEQMLSEKGYEYLYNMLKENDPQSCERIHYNDQHRILRAFEVWYQTRIPISDHWKNQSNCSNLKSFDIILSLERAELYDRINRRVDIMMNEGLLDEIRDLLSAGYSFSDSGFNTVGYKEFAPFFDGSDGLSFCIDKVKQHSRNYAKRQLTWYRKINFNFAYQIKVDNLSDIESKIQNFLEGGN